MRPIVQDVDRLVARPTGVSLRCGVLAAATALLVPTAGIAKQPQENGVPGAIHELREALTGQLADLQNDIEGLATALDVQVSVDTGFCESVPVQCFDGPYEQAYGRTASALGPVGNQSPLLLTMLVSHNGVPVTGLTSGAFAVDIDVIPAGGVYVGICEEAASGSRCVPNFHEFDNGHYWILLDPVIDEAYKAGGYSGTVVVSFSADGRIYHGSALVTWTIPPGPPEE